MTILVIGAGSIGTKHLKNLLKLGYKDLAVCDPDEKKPESLLVLGKFNFYNNVKTAMEREQPDVVFVCNPTHLHVATASLALNYGAHVFIEKPLSHNLKGVGALVKKSRKLKKVVMVACNYRFNRSFIKFASDVKRNKFGKPILANITLGYFLPAARANANYKKIYAAERKGGGVVLDSGSHVADYLRALLGPIKNSKINKSKIHSIDTKSEEAASVVFEHENGVISSLSMDYLRKTPVHTIEILAEDGKYELDFRKNKKDLDGMFIEELKHFFSCVKKKSKPLQDLSDAKVIVNVLTK
ncbi:Gfo/Idh/MocA family oxidoreductase [Candidatus Giovannonibacteria bacterium]|nr:Gfo/Idh/MocA family oxidoreductase [Candidatus Giovannonibacteria bacterium]